MRLAQRVLPPGLWPGTAATRFLDGAWLAWGAPLFAGGAAHGALHPTQLTACATARLSTSCSNSTGTAPAAAVVSPPTASTPGTAAPWAGSAGHSQGYPGVPSRLAPTMVPPGGIAHHGPQTHGTPGPMSAVPRQRTRKQQVADAGRALVAALEAGLVTAAEVQRALEALRRARPHDAMDPGEAWSWGGARRQCVCVEQGGVCGSTRALHRGMCTRNMFTHVLACGVVHRETGGRCHF